jgi:hypothetical protein
VLSWLRDEEWLRRATRLTAGILSRLHFRSELLHYYGGVEIKEGGIIAQSWDEVEGIGEEASLSRAFEHF